MCGRFTLGSSPAEIAQHFRVEVPHDLAPRYNIAPGQPIAVIRRPEPGAAPVFERRLWGLVPHWARDPRIGHRLINARSETAATRPAFRDALARRRCLIPADGFYEWGQAGKRKQPYWIALREGGLFAIAGLYESWRDPEGRSIESCTLLTAPANECLRPIHERMPVILPPEAYEVWLDPGLRDPRRLAPWLVPFPPQRLRIQPVGWGVNDPSHEGRELIEPVSIGGGGSA